jgi:hypothetical protein
VGPDLEPASVNLSQVAPGVYESPVASLQSGAYAVRVTQTRPGAAALGRTLGLVAPTAAEYRLLGANEPLLAAIRAATGGEQVELPAEVWAHDLQTTSRYTDMWPWLLVLALLLWPLDIALRRVSLGRRELADGRRWASERIRGRRVAARTQASESMLAARERAGSAGARSAILREASDRAAGADAATPAGPPVPASPGPATDAAQPAARAESAAPPPPPLATALPPPPPPPSSPAAPPATEGPSDDTLARLRDAKRRNRS